MAYIYDEENETYLKTGKDVSSPEKPCPECGEEMVGCEWCSECGYPH